MNLTRLRDESFNVDSAFFVRLFFCYYFDINGSRLLRWSAKLYCVVCGTLLTCYVLYLTNIYKLIYSIPLVFISLDFYINVIVSCYTGERYFFRFCHEIKAIDIATGIGKEISKTTQRFINLLVVCILFIKIVYFVSYCYFSFNCQSAPVHVVFSSFLIVASDVNHISRLITLFLVLSRMHVLSKKIEHHRTRSRDVNEPMINWTDYLNMYWQLMDCFRSIELPMKNLILINLFTAFPKLLMWIYSSVILYDPRDNGYNPIGAVVVTCFENANVALLTSLPGVMVAMIQSRVDRIKLALATRLYLSKDAIEVADVRRFLELIELRPFEMRILRLIPVDMNLPAGLLSLCLTYLIVLAQIH